MKKQSAINIMIGLVLSIILFHLLIIIKIIPYDITWGGRLKNDNEMYLFESISIFINLLLCITLLIKGEFIKSTISIKIVDIVLWIFLVIFVLNTIGNVFAETMFEKLFSVLTLLFSYLLWVIVKKSKVNELK